MRGMAVSVRFRSDEPRIFDAQSPAIYCIWHNRLALCMEVFSRFYLKQGHQERRIAALVSASKDGAILSSILEAYGLHPVRGSSSRRGSQAMRELIALTRKGYDLAITPDGPRGPIYQVQHGVISLAQLTGCRIIPVSFVLSRKWELNSWDRFQVPKPFAQCIIRLGKPIPVDRSISSSQRDALALELSNALIQLGEDEAVNQAS